MHSQSSQKYHFPCGPTARRNFSESYSSAAHCHPCTPTRFLSVSILVSEIAVEGDKYTYRLYRPERLVVSLLIKQLDLAIVENIVDAPTRNCPNNCTAIYMDCYLLLFVLHRLAPSKTDRPHSKPVLRHASKFAMVYLVAKFLLG